MGYTLRPINGEVLEELLQKEALKHLKVCAGIIEAAAKFSSALKLDDYNPRHVKISDEDANFVDLMANAGAVGMSCRRCRLLIMENDADSNFAPGYITYLYYFKVKVEGMVQELIGKVKKARRQKSYRQKKSFRGS